MEKLIYLVFKEREEHKGFVYPKRDSMYVGHDKEKALNTFKDIEDGQLVIISEHDKIELVKKDYVLSVN